MPTNDIYPFNIKLSIHKERSKIYWNSILKVHRDRKGLNSCWNIYISTKLAHNISSSSLTSVYVSKNNNVACKTYSYIKFVSHHEPFTEKCMSYVEKAFLLTQDLFLGLCVRNTISGGIFNLLVYLCEDILLQKYS